MADIAPLLGGPQAASPDALKARRLAALLQQKEGMSIEPIRSPWQGVGRVAQSIAGGLEQYQTDQGEVSARKDAASKLAAALKGDDLGAAIGAMSDPWTNPEAAKTVAGALSPQIKDMGTYEQALDRFGHPVGPPISKQSIAIGEAGGAKAPIGTISGGPGGATMTPLQQGGSGGPPVFRNGALQGNLTSDQGQPPTGQVPTAPPSGTVAQSPAMPTSLPALSNFANKQAAEKKGMETTADAQAKYYDSLHTGLAGNRNIAAQQKVNLSLLKDIASSPSLISGSGSEVAVGLQRLAAQVGVDPTGAAPRELFNMVSAKVLADQFAGMKSLSRETGEAGARIFAPMLKLEELANVTPHDSIEGTKAKINIIDKMGDQAIKYGNMADDYIKGHGRLDPEFDKALNKEIANARIPNAVPRAQVPKEASDYLRANPQLREHFDRKYGNGAAASVLGQ